MAVSFNRMITPLFTSCPTFSLSQLPSSSLGKEGTFLPRMHHNLASAWPQPPWCQSLAAGGVTFRSFLSNENRLLWLSDCVGIGSPCRANRSDVNGPKIKDRSGQSLNLLQRPTFHYLSYCVGQIALRYSRCRCPVPFLSPFAFVSWQRLVARSVYRSLAVQGGEAESVMSWHSVLHKNTSMAFEPTQLHSSQECSHITQHPLSPHLCPPATWH